MKLPQNVTLRIGDLTLSLAQERKSHIDVAVLCNGEFVDSALWSDTPHIDSGDTATIFSGDALAAICKNVQKLANFADHLKGTAKETTT